MTLKAVVAPERESDDWSSFCGSGMTVEEFLALDDAEETDLEYIDGVVTEKAVVTRSHGNIVGELSGHFWVHRKRTGGEFGPERRVRLASGRYLKPDLAYYAAGTQMGNDAIPTVAIEVRSRSETMASQRRKCRRYIEAGVPVVWLIDPVSRSVEVFTEGVDAEPLPSDGVLSASELPGFELALRELFAVIDDGVD